MNFFSSNGGEEDKESKGEKKPVASGEPEEDSKEDTKEDEGDSAANSDEKGDETTNTNCALALDIVVCVCLYIMSIFFLCGAIFFHPGITDDNNLPAEPYTFWLMGVLCYVTMASIEVTQSVPKKKVITIVNKSVALLGGVFWFVGSIFLFSSTYDIRTWAALWLIGVLMLLYVITFDLVTLFVKTSPKPLFQVISLAMAWLANFIFFAGSAHVLFLADNGADKCNVTNVAGLFMSGALLYLIHAVFFTLAKFKGNITFSIQISS